MNLSLRTMTDTTRDLIQRMATELDLCRQMVLDDCTSTHPLADEARAYLAQPEPEGPTVMEIIALADEIEAEELGQVDLVRRALARWGRPAVEPVPVSERLPGPEDCMDEGWAWFYTPRGDWIKAVLPVSPAYTHWLPHYALPIPPATKKP